MSETRARARNICAVEARESRAREHPKLLVLRDVSPRTSTYGFLKDRHVTHVAHDPRAARSPASPPPTGPLGARLSPLATPQGATVLNVRTQK